MGWWYPTWDQHEERENAQERLYLSLRHSRKMEQKHQHNIEKHEQMLTKS
jgi:hypothetical protein